MIRLFFVLILWAGLLVLTVWERKKPAPLWKWMNLSLTVLGTATVILCRILAGIMISSSGQSQTWIDWAEDMFAQHYSLSFPVLFVLLGVLLTSWLLSLAEKRNRSKTGNFLRMTVGLLASAVLLLLAPLYGFMTANDFVPLDTLILFSGTGEAMILRLVPALEGFFNGKKQEQK